MTRGRVRGPGRGPGRILARARLARGGRDRGASAVELAILAPALIFASLLIVQFAIWFDARHAALAAAQQGDLVAREDASVNPGGWQGLAENAATSYYRGPFLPCDINIAFDAIQLLFRNLRPHLSCFVHRITHGYPLGSFGKLRHKLVFDRFFDKQSRTSATDLSLVIENTHHGAGYRMVQIRISKNYIWRLASKF